MPDRKILEIQFRLKQVLHEFDRTDDPELRELLILQLRRILQTAKETSAFDQSFAHAA
jgi:hypothetical protein